MRLLLGSCLLLTACASDPSWVYSRPDTSDETRRQDFKACQDKTGHLAMISTVAGAIDHTCMTQLGYSQQMWSNPR